MDITRINALLDILETDINFSDDIQENKEGSLHTIDRIREELNK
jgi:hypothetical protein